MAGVAESIYKTSSQALAQTGNMVDKDAMAKGIQAGAQLAQRKNALIKQQADLQQLKVEAKHKAIGNTLKLVETAQKFKSEADQRRFLKGALPNAASAYGTEDVFTPAMQDLLINSSDSRGAAGFLLSRVRRGDMSQQDAIKMLNEAGMADAIEMKAFNDAEEFAISETGKSARSKDQITAAQVNKQATIEAAREAKNVEYNRFPEKENIKSVTKAHTDFKRAGGFAKIKNNKAMAERILEKLKSGKLKTGTPALKAMGALPFVDQMNAIRLMDSDLALAVDQAQSVINVKNALDSQFSDAMAVRVFSRIMDPLASNEANIERFEEFLRVSEGEETELQKLFASAGLGEAPVERKTEAKEAASIPPQQQIDDYVSKIMKRLSTGEPGDTVLSDILKDNPNMTPDNANLLIRKAQNNIKGQ